MNLVPSMHRLTLVFSPLQSAFLLALRLWLAWAFFRSGLTKIASMDTTVQLFEYEYAVPLLSPVLAAWLAVIAELALPPLLALGALSRLTALALFVFNAVARYSYPDISPAGIVEHEMWGLGFLVVFLFGAGKLSLDRWFCQRFCAA